MYVLLANSVALFHLLYVVIVIALVPLILIGWWRGWTWVRNFWIRVLHLAMIGVVVLEVACGWTCPLTTWERQLRIEGGQLELELEPDGKVIMDRVGQPRTRYFESYQNDFVVKIMNALFYFDPDQLSFHRLVRCADRREFFCRLRGCPARRHCQRCYRHAP